MNESSEQTTALPCRYQELHPALENFLSEYLADGQRKGLKESSIHLHDKIGRYFLAAASYVGCTKPDELNAKNIGAACLRINPWYWSQVRTFLRYAYHSGYTDRDYSGIVPAFKRPQPFPSVYSAAEVQKIENGVNQDTPHGKRDYAALLLSTRLGIRSGDISSMTFDSLDFERETITITQQKTGVPIELPMVPDVKSALERYISQERSDNGSPYVFLRIIPPYDHISVQLIGKIVHVAIKNAGINPGNRKQGGHAFRASLASSMVNDNVSYEVVRKTLGHTDQNAIASYARLDINQLRDYALPVPKATGAFAAFLEGRRTVK